jgi:predicted tellurium resistance membrane protein TerC
MLEFLTWENGLALLTLSALEIVLGIDNIVFIAILAGKLPPEQRAKARRVGLLLAMVMRVGLLLGISWVMGLTADLFSVWGHGFSGRDLILLVGGIFLIAKATHEIHSKLEGPEVSAETPVKHASFPSIVVQIVLMDIIFSLDSVITAVGMVEQGDSGEHKKAALAIMIIAILIAVGVMLIFARTVSDFVERRPTIKMLALSFLLLIGVMLVAEGFGTHIQKGYIYFAMGFSLFVEILNLRLRRKSAAPVHLHDSTLPPP